MNSKVRKIKESYAYYPLDNTDRININVLLAEITRLESVLLEIDTHIRSTEDPIPYIIDTLKRSMPEYYH